MSRRTASFCFDSLHTPSGSGGISPLTSQNPKQLVDTPGQLFTTTGFATTIAEGNKRFRIKLSERDIERQLERRIKLLSQFALPPFSPTSEENFENWVDDAAAIITKNQICVSLFQDAWSAVAPPSMARHISSIPIAESHELLVNKVAALLYKSPLYLRRFEVQMLQPQRQATVFEARFTLEDTIARLYRLCVRWNHEFYMSDVRCIEMALQSLPQHLEEDIRAFYDEPLWDEVWKRAESREERMKYQSYIAFPAHNPLLSDTTMHQQHQVPPPSPPEKRQPYSPCPSCSGSHWKKDCPYKKTRCFSCGLIGHISKACRNLALKDNKGRVETRVEPKSSSIVMHQRKDRTQQDKMLSAESTIAGLREVAAQRSLSASAKRHDKRKAEGKIVRQRNPHPVALTQLQYSEEESEAELDDESSIQDGLEHIQHVCLAQENKPERSVVLIDVTVNEKKRQAIADTGASRTLVDRKDAKALNIRVNESGIPRRFAGLGICEGQPSKPTNVTLGKRTKSVIFYIVDKPGLPLLISKNDLAQFNVFVDPVTSNLVDRSSLEIVAVGIEYQSDQPAEQPELDVITQKKLGATDEELFEEGRKTIDEKTMHLPKELQQQVWELFAEFKDIWLRPRPGAATNHVAHYDYDGPVVKQQQRHLAPDLEEEFKRQTKAMIESQVLEDSKSPFASAPVFTKKKDGGWRLCLDYREVNKHIKPDRYPIPRLWDCVLKAAHHNFYCCLDVNWGFWSLPLDAESREITAILTPYGLKQFTVTPFGIRNSPPEFQRMIDAVFSFIEKLQKYIDDLVLHTYTIEEMFALLRQVLERFRSGGLFLKLSKLELFQSEVTMLGFLVGINGVRPHPKKVQGIKDAVFPRSKKQMRSFLGAISFLRKFIPHLATIIAPLTHLTRKGTPYRADVQHVKAFNHAKALLSEHILLNAPKGDGAFVVVTDASEHGAGAALLQWQANELVVLEFASKTLSKAETKWPAYEREAYAIRWAIGRFEDYVKAGKVIVVSDHMPLQALYKATNNKVLRWSLFLQQFDLDIRHINGEQNEVADWLSRSVPYEDPFDDDNNVSLPSFYVPSDHLLSEINNPQASHFIPFIPTVDQLRVASLNLSPDDVKDTYLSPEGIRYHIRSNKIYLPPSMRESFLYLFHVTHMGLHLGINRTIRRLSKWVWWPKLNKSVRDYINACLVCIRKFIPSRLMSLYGVLSRPLPLQLISLDFVGPRTWSNSSTYYYLVIIDHASRFLVSCSTDRAPTADWLLNKFRRLWVSIFAAPTAVLHDRGSEFTSQVFNEYLINVLRSIVVHTSSYYPQGNAINESSHRSIDTMLSTCASQYNTSFANALHLATLIHNSTPHASTGHSPFFFLHGFEPILPGLQPFQSTPQSLTSHLDQLASLRHNALCRANLEADTSLNVVKKKSPIKVGDWVVYLLPSSKEKVKQDLSNKFSKMWSLPAKVLQVNDQQVTVSTWSTQTKIDIPISKARVLQGDIPISLLKLNLDQLQVTSPPELSPPHFIDGKSPSSWSTTLEKAQSASSPANHSSRKRRRTNLSVHFDD